MRIPLNGKLSVLHEFEDHKLEQEYSRAQIIQSLKYMRTLAFCLGIIFFLFIIVDYMANSLPATVLFILGNRVLICLCAFGLYFYLSVSKQYERFYYLYNITIALSSVSFFLICLSYERPNYLLQVMGLISIVLVVFMVPNRWFSKLLVASGITIAFFVIIAVSRPDIAGNDFFAGVVYALFILALRAISTYKNESQRRLLYLNGRQLEILSKTDSMTGLYNRETLSEDLEYRISQVKSSGDDFGIVLFDIDDFKAINDTYGHLMGDKVLLEIVNMVEQQLTEDCPMYRWGGEEFIIIFPDCSHYNCVELSDKLCRGIDNLKLDEVRVTCSFGIACYHIGDTIQTMLARADNNLYTAKSAGKNCVMSHGVRCAERCAQHCALV